MEERMFFSKIQQGDTASFEWLYKRYHPRMYMFCKGILHDEDKAKDLVQECFIVFWEHRTQINAPEAISVYLFRIMKHLCLKQIRRDSLLNNFSNMNEVALRELELSHYTPECNILNDLYFKDLSEKYQEALDKLPRQCQNIFRMNRNEGMRSEEIAIALNLSVRTVENQLYRGLKQIKKSMQDYLPVLLLLLVKNFLK